MSAELLVEVLRAGRVESEHFGQIAVADREGGLRLCLGDPQAQVFLRSAGKPLQAMAIVMSGAAERFRLDDADIAIAVASHTGEDVHLQQVQRLLEKVGVRLEDLQCGPHPPSDRAAAAALRRLGGSPTALHNNCSGKHAGMLAVAKVLGADLRGYLDPDAPGQRLVREIVTTMGGVPASALHVGVDGCSAPVFALPLRAIATCYARLAAPEDLPGEYRRAALRVREAMRAHPYLLAGRGRIGPELMRVSQGRLVAKTGAEAVYGVGDVGRALGLALKVRDGAERAVGPALVEALGQSGMLAPEETAALGEWHRPPVRNFAGRVTGLLRANFRLRP